MRTFDTNNANSQISVNWGEKMTDAMTMEFWLKAFVLSSTGTVKLIDSGFTLVYDGDNNCLKFTDQDGKIITSAKLLHLRRWMHVGVSVILNTPNLDQGLSFIDIDGVTSSYVSITKLTTNFGTNTKSVLVIGPSLNPPAIHTKIAIKEFILWSIYKSPGEINGLKYRKPASYASGLHLYLPLDESSGKVVFERVNNQVIVTGSETSWMNYDKEQNVEFYSSNSLRNEVAFALQRLSGVPTAVGEVVVKTALPRSLGLYEEYTIMAWMMFGQNPSFDLNIFADTCFNLNINTNMMIVSNTTKITPRTNPIVANTWVSIGFTTSVGSYNNPKYNRMYVNGVQVTTNEFPTVQICSALTLVCYDSSGNVLQSPNSPLRVRCKYDSPDNYFMKLSSKAYGNLAVIKEIKIFGSVLNNAEFLVETYRKGNPHKYMSYLRHYWSMDEYPSYEFNEYAIDHIKHIYGLYTPTSNADNIKMVDESFWISNSPPVRCESYDFYDTKLKKCYSPNKALMFVKGYTHSITIQTVSVDQNFTFEFWVNLAREENGFQEIMRARQLTVKYENKVFAFTVFGSSILESNGYKSTYTPIANEPSVINTWTHIAVANTKLLDLSSLCVNGIQRGYNKSIDFDNSITAWVLSNDTYGFTGMIRYIRIWNLYRSQGRTHADMHTNIWDYNGLNFNLVKFIPLDEARGFALYDYSSYNPGNLMSYRAVRAGLISPYWARSDTLPLLCSYNEIFDKTTESCRSIKKVLEVTSLILPTKKVLAYRDWSFHTWVRFTSTTATIIVSNIFTLSVSSNSLKVSLYGTSLVITSTPNTPLVTTKWYHINVAYSYALKKTYIDYDEAANFPMLNTDVKGNLQYDTNSINFRGYYGMPTITLSNGYYMHVSLWKKFFPRSRLDFMDNAVVPPSLYDYANPYLFILLLAFSILKYTLI